MMARQPLRQLAPAKAAPASIPPAILHEDMGRDGHDLR